MFNVIILTKLYVREVNALEKVVFVKMATKDRVHLISNKHLLIVVKKPII